jgi:hypothetical protein
MSIIWKFMNRRSWRTKCSRYCVMERRYSHDSAFTERYTPRRKPLYLLPSGEVTTFFNLETYCFDHNRGQRDTMA